MATRGSIAPPGFGKETTTPAERLRAWEVPVHESLNRPILMFGMEQRFALLAIYFVFSTVMLSRFNWKAIVFAVVCWVAMHATGVWLAKRDPFFVDVYKRSLTYQDYYPGAAPLGAQPDPVNYRKRRSAW